MTSEKYFRKWVKEAGRGHVVAFLAWGLLVGYALMTMARLSLSTESGFFGIGSGELFYICAGLGGALSFLEFFYLLQPQKLDFYYSLPVKKRTIFWSRYVHGLLHFLAPLVLVMTACGLFESNLDMEFYPYSASYTGHSILVFAAVFLLFYHMGILMISISGNVLPAILGYVLLLYYGHILVGNVFVTWAEHNFRTYYRILLFEKLDVVLTPFSLAEQLTGKNLFDKIEVFEFVPSVFYIAAAVVWVLGLFLLLVAAQGLRKTERIGRLFAFSLSERVAQSLLSFLAGVGSASLFTELSGLSEKSYVASGIASILVGVAVAVVAHMAFEWCTGGTLRRKGQLACECAAVVLTGAAFFIGAFGFDSFLPSEDEVAEIGVSIAGLDMDYGDYGQAMAKGEQYETERQLKKYRLSEEGKDAAFAWITSLIFEDDEEENISQVTVCYSMKDGSEIYRQYPIDEADLDGFAFVYDTEEYKEIAYLAGVSKRVADAKFVWTDAVTDTVLRLSDEEKTALLDAYEEDVAELEMENLREALPGGFVEVTSEAPYYANQMVVYPFFTKTCELLEQYGVQWEKRLADYPVRSVSVIDVSENGLGRVSSKHYEEPKEVEEWTQWAVPKGFDLQPLLFPLDYSRELKVEVRDEETNSTIYVNAYDEFD